MPPQRSIATNVAFNLVGQLAPAVAATLAMPWLLRGLGAERLGVLSLAWVAVGAFTLLDFGLGRALTLEVSRRRALGDESGLAPIVQGTVLVLATIGALLAAGLVDRLSVYVGATLLGTGAKPGLDWPGPASITTAPRLRLVEVRTLGDDVRLDYVPADADPGRA